MARNKSQKRRVPTITFQPDDDVLDIIEAEMNKLKKQGVEMTRGLRSKIVNMAMRASGKEAAERILKIHELERGSPKSE